jgi:1-acyl-sn-glycerol-3-phosphate acyltransferase
LSGAGRLALAVPEARLICAAASGVTDIASFPRRPRIRVDFFEPEGGQAQEGESAIRLTRRIMGQIRQRAPYAAAGRRRAQPPAAPAPTEVSSQAQDGPDALAD